MRKAKAKKASKSRINHRKAAHGKAKDAKSQSQKGHQQMHKPMKKQQQAKNETNSPQEFKKHLLGSGDHFNHTPPLKLSAPARETDARARAVPRPPSRLFPEAPRASPRSPRFAATRPPAPGRWPAPAAGACFVFGRWCVFGLASQGKKRGAPHFGSARFFFLLRNHKEKRPQQRPPKQK